VDPVMGAQFRAMAADRRLDLDSRKGKAPGGYQETFQESRHPFIFMNAVGTNGDLETMLHEAGHAFHAYASRSDPLFWYRNPPLEFCEVASMGMELLAAPFLGEFYPPAERQRAVQDHLEGIILFLPRMAVIDGFQHWVYTNPGHSREQRRGAWTDLCRRFGTADGWDGHAEFLTHGWKRVLHLFEVPFYYVEYGIAQLGALQVWRISRQDRALALGSYQRALALGGSRPLPELFAAAGGRFAFDVDTVRPLVELVRAELAGLD
jgi:oligoendopeptidase F